MEENQQKNKKNGGRRGKGRETWEEGRDKTHPSSLSETTRSENGPHKEVEYFSQGRRRASLSKTEREAE
jgi:hypothetical protein